jgi:type IV secretory pathway VirB2 component (pilin)
MSYDAPGGYGSSSLVGALTWVENVLLGTTATVVGVIAVASIGLMMLSGRVDVKQGIRTVVGLLVVFGAPTIASAIEMQLRQAATEAPGYAIAAASEPPLPAEQTPPPKAFDPYAGASVLN